MGRTVNLGGPRLSLAANALGLGVGACEGLLPLEIGLTADFARLGLALAAVFHGNALALAAHAVVHGRAILFRKIEPLQPHVDHLDAGVASELRPVRFAAPRIASHLLGNALAEPFDRRSTLEARPSRLSDPIP